jgi:hypothetical protein
VVSFPICYTGVSFMLDAYRESPLAVSERNTSFHDRDTSTATHRDMVNLLVNCQTRRQSHGLGKAACMYMKHPCSISMQPPVITRQPNSSTPFSNITTSLRQIAPFFVSSHRQSVIILAAKNGKHRAAVAPGTLQTVQETTDVLERIQPTHQAV